MIEIMIMIGDGWFETCYGKVQYVGDAWKYKFTGGRVTHDGMCSVGTYMRKDQVGTNSDLVE